MQIPDWVKMWAAVSATVVPITIGVVVWFDGKIEGTRAEARAEFHAILERHDRMSDRLDRTLERQDRMLERQDRMLDEIHALSERVIVIEQQALSDKS